MVTLKGWEISRAASRSGLNLSDETARAKVLVKSSPGGQPPVRVTATLGRAVRLPDDVLEVGSGPGEWMLLGPPGSADRLFARRSDVEVGAGRAGAVVDLTHAMACLRLDGRASTATLAKVCAVDLSDAASPNGKALRSSVAKVVTDVIRDDTAAGPSYLLLCDRSFAQYLFDSLLDAGTEWGIDVVGFSTE
jgi:heterotetrameric sarcosine oxidase gamma subunit